MIEMQHTREVLTVRLVFEDNPDKPKSGYGIEVENTRVGEPTYIRLLDIPERAGSLGDKMAREILSHVKAHIPALALGQSVKKHLWTWKKV